MEDDDAFGQGTGEARDSISNLPRKVAIQVCACETLHFYCINVFDCFTWNKSTY